MINTEQIVAMIKESTDYEEKYQAVSLIIASIKSKKLRLNKKTRLIMASFAVSEMGTIISAAEKAPCYRIKSNIFHYADILFGLIMATHKTRADFTQEALSLLNEVSSYMKNEARIEDRIDTIFSQDIISVSDVDALLEELSGIDDEYAKGILYSGFLHYKNDLGKLLESSKKRITAYIEKEMARYIEEYSSSVDIQSSLENACDLCAYFPSDALAELLKKALSLGNHKISLYAIISLLKANKEIPLDIIDDMAKDPVYAYGIYNCLKYYGKESLFPAELSTNEYLAKSDLVHWLTFPTELGKVPDEIEYIGKTEVKKETFHIFRYRSDSSNLPDDLKNVWLIGWSSNEGGTFSQFDRLDKYEKKTTVETIKNIKRKIL